MNMRHLLLAMTALAPASAAFAQAPAPAPAADTPDAGIPDIIVTARKREENLQDAPVAITAFGADEIQSARIERLSDIGKLTPGLVFTPLFGRQNQLPIIRGQSQSFGELNVGVFLDGIYLSGKGGVDTELNDLQRVEVVRGPQSALYGRNTFAGAINYVTMRPSAQLTGRIEGTVGSNDLYKVLGSVSGPISEKIRFRVGGFYREFRGYYNSAVDGGRVDFEKSYGGIATLEIKPVEQLTATFRVSYSKNDDGQPPSNIIRTNYALGTPSGGSAAQPRFLQYSGELPTVGYNQVLVNTRPVAGLPGGSYGDREETVRASGTLEYDFGNATATSITSYSHRNVDYTYDGDNTVCDRVGGCPTFGFPFVTNIPYGKTDFALSSLQGYLRDWSQELRFASSGRNKIDWLFGMFFYTNKNYGIDRNITPPGTLAITDYSTQALVYRYPVAALNTRTFSAFASATWHATDALSITGELRYEYEQKRYQQGPLRYGLGATATTSVIVNGVAVPVAGSNTSFDLKQDFRFTTPRIIVNYKIDADKMIYGLFARGAKTGGFNTGLNIALTPDTQGQRSYNPEYSDNYEIGVKTDWLDRHLRVNLTGFYVNWRDQQIPCQNPPAAGGSSTNRTYICNFGASHIYGLESEVIARFNDVFSVSGSYTYTHARYVRFLDDSLAAVLVAAGLPAYNFNGRSLPYVPDHKVVITPRINVPFGRAKVEARADFQYQSRTYVRADNLNSLGDKTVVDLRLGMTLDNLSVQLFANNVFKDKTPVAAVRFFDSVNYFVAAPLVTGPNLRQFGLTVGYKF